MTRLAIVAAMLVALLTGGPGAAVAQALPPAAVLIIDISRIQSQSLVGQDVQRQVQALRKRLQTELEKKQNEIKAMSDKLQKERASLTQQQFQARAREVDARAQAFNKEVEERQAMVQRALRLADNEIDRALRPILQELMDKKKANFVFDRSQVALAVDSIDVTAEVIKKLDKKLPTLTLDLSDLSK